MHRPKAQVIALGTAAAAVAAGAGTYVATHPAAGRQGGAQHAISTAANVQAARRAQPLKVLSVTPAAGTRHANGGEPVRVQFSAPLAAGSPRPVLSPAVPGQWSAAGSTLTFAPQRPFSPQTTVTIRVAAGSAGVRSVSGGHLSAPVTTRFATGSYSSVRLAQLLAQLGYLPLKWTQGQDQTRTAAAATSADSQAAMAYSPPAGNFSWDQGYPAALRAQWAPDSQNLVVKGALMAFEAQHGMTVTGVAGPQLWTALLAAAAAGNRNAAGYSYAVASQRQPETLTIWHNGRQVMHSLANTGIPVAPTADGTFPVYLRYRFQVMQGTNPDGSSYSDPVSFVSYFHGGDAVHYFARGSYGSQQSLGCVELPYSAAQQAYPYLTYGSLVTVSG